MSNVLVRQVTATSDGFLNSTEYSMWASCMRLQEDEAHPALPQSHFMSLPTDPPPQVYFSDFPWFVCFSLFLVQLLKVANNGSEIHILWKKVTVNSDIFNGPL